MRSESGQQPSDQGTTEELQFGFQYLKQHIDSVAVRVAQVQKDFLEHELYKVEFLRDNVVIYENSRRYTQFAAFHEMLLIKFKNIELDHFPSKWQLFKKISHRMEYFNKMMNKLLRFARDHPEARQKMLTCIVSFVGPQLEMNVRREEGVRKKSDSIGNSPTSNKLEEAKMSKSGLARTEQQLPKQPEPKEFWSRATEVGSMKVQRKEVTYYFIRFEGEYSWKERYLKVNGSVLEIYKDISKNTWENKIELYRIRVEYLRSPPDLLDHFMQKMEFQDMPTYPEDYKYLSIYHEHDCKKLLITTPEASSEAINQDLSKLYEKLVVASTHSHFRDDYVGYFGSVGKVYFAFYELKFAVEMAEEDKHSFWVVRLRTSAFSYDTRQVQNKDTKIKQGIIIPISNSFEEFIVELVRMRIEGLISEEIKEKVYASGHVLMNDMLSYTSDSKFERLFIKLYPVHGPRTNEVASIETTIRNMSDFSSIYSDSYVNGNDGRVLDYEKMSNREILGNLNMTIDRLLYVVGCICLFVQTTWRNLYFFKYPRLAGLVFTLLALAFLLADMNNIVGFLVMMLCFAIIYNNTWVYAIANELAEKFFMGKKHLHPDFKQPLILSKSEFKYLKWSGNLQRIKMKFDADNNLLEEPKHKERFFLLKKGDNEYRVEEEKQNLYQKFTEVKTTIQEIHSIINSVVATFEKIASIYSWADFRRTLYFLVFVVVLIVLANAVALRLIGFLMCLHRFKKGYTYYRRHYASNRKIAHEVLAYTIKKNFRELFANLPLERAVDVEDLYLPIEEEGLKKFKKVLESLLPVCINYTEILQAQKQLQTDPKPAEMPYGPTDNPIHKYILNKKIRISYFVDLIETCESKLKLQKLIFAEGRSEDYQRLKEDTKEYPAIDIWLEDLIQNYVLNSPSKLYTTMTRTIHQQNNLFDMDIVKEPSSSKADAVNNIMQGNMNPWASEEPHKKTE